MIVLAVVLSIISILMSMWCVFATAAVTRYTNRVARLLANLPPETRDVLNGVRRDGGDTP